MGTKKVFSIIQKCIAFFVVFGLLFITQLSNLGRAIEVDKPADAEWLVDEGEDHIWYQFADNVLTVGGVGEMPDWASGKDTPWYDSVTAVDDYTVVIGRGITRVGNNSFQGARKDDMYADGLTKVFLSETLASIGDSAFMGSGWIEIVVLKNPNPPTIGEDAFQNTNEAITFAIPSFAKTTYLNSEQWRDYLYIEGDYINTFLAYFVYTNSSDGGSVSSSMDLGYILADEYAPETVALTVTPESDYFLKNLTVVDENGAEVSLEGDSFVMPESCVFINAEFAAEEPEEPEEPEVPKVPNTGVR